VFEYRVLRRIFGLKRDEATGDWRKLCNEGLIICTLHQIIRVIKSVRMRWMGLVACIVEVRNVNKIEIRKPESKRGLRSARHRWGGNIKMDHKDIR
jgi:hypothetical protein